MIDETDSLNGGLKSKMLNEIAILLDEIVSKLVYVNCRSVCS